MEKIDLSQTNYKLLFKFINGNYPQSNSVDKSIGCFHFFGYYPISRINQNELKHEAIN